MLFASFCPWVRVPIGKNWPEVRLPPYSNSPRWLAPDGIYWQSQYYVDLYLPFGLRSASFLFNQFSDFLEWILQNNYGLRHVLHILDNFFIAEPTRLKCLTSFSTLLRVLMSLQALVVASKTLGPSQELDSWVSCWTAFVWKLAVLTINSTAPGKSSIPLPSYVLSAYLNCNLLLAPLSLRANPWSQGEPSFKGWLI